MLFVWAIAKLIGLDADKIVQMLPPKGENSYTTGKRRTSVANPNYQWNIHSQWICYRYFSTCALAVFVEAISLKY
ncbi:hypothetical protein [Nostoc sp.]|uniref:hypothetical protein n=1 Tax=Nostoc sp. TaxID=1180 RepID=UPI002FFD5030